MSNIDYINDLVLLSNATVPLLKFKIDIKNIKSI